MDGIKLSHFAIASSFKSGEISNALAKAYVAAADGDLVTVSETPGDKQKVQVPPRRRFMTDG